MTMGLVDIAFSYTKAITTERFYSSIYMLFVGAILLVYAITSHLKFKANRKQLERELSKEYDERDDLIEGKASYLTINIIMIVIFLIMFLSKWIIIPTNTALFIIIIFCILTNTLAKKYYNHYL